MDRVVATLRSGSAAASVAVAFLVLAQSAPLGAADGWIEVETSSMSVDGPSVGIGQTSVPVPVVRREDRCVSYEPRVCTPWWRFDGIRQQSVPFPVLGERAYDVPTADARAWSPVVVEASCFVGAGSVRGVNASVHADPEGDHSYDPVRVTSVGTHSNWIFAAWIDSACRAWGGAATTPAVLVP